MRAILFVLAVSCCLAQRTGDKLIEVAHWKRTRALVYLWLRDAPDNAEANLLSSQIPGAFGDGTAPLELAEKAVRLDGNVVRYYRQLADVQGVIAQRSGILQELILARRFRKEIEAALSLDHRNVQARRDLMEFYLLAPAVPGRNIKKADAVPWQISALDAAQGYLARARIAEARQDHSEMAAMRRAADVQPPSYTALMTLAQYDLAPERPDYGEAEAPGKCALAMDKGRVGAYSVLATVHAGRGQWDALDSILSAAARRVPDDATPYYRAAERIFADGRVPSPAQRYLRVYLAQEPEGKETRSRRRKQT